MSFESLSLYTTSATLPSFAAVTATLNSVSDYGSWASVFDQYRITAMEVTVMPQYSATTTITTVTGHIHSVIDYDDNTTITPAQALEYSNCIVYNPGDTSVRSFKPHIAAAAYSGTFTSYANLADQWIDSGSPGVVHFGMKLAASATGIPVTYDVVVRLVVQFRNPR